MSQHYRCDVCGEEMSAPIAARQETTFVRGSRSGINLTVRAHLVTARSNDIPDLCGACFIRGIVQAFGIELEGAG